MEGCQTRICSLAYHPQSNKALIDVDSLFPPFTHDIPLHCVLTHTHKGWFYSNKNRKQKQKQAFSVFTGEKKKIRGLVSAKPNRQKPHGKEWVKAGQSFVIQSTNKSFDSATYKAEEVLRWASSFSFLQPFLCNMLHRC